MIENSLKKTANDTACGTECRYCRKLLNLFLLPRHNMKSSGYTRCFSGINLYILGYFPFDSADEQHATSIFVRERP